ncbi:hypothetical protein IC229_32335 [Spirosoma sp. BT702]|uniref:Uncharacterized protein n=1 Tax=Spirosoma profusum TaxID=2771354 RepID=A0A927AVX5_9BACT|nr:hypothetical protein [Spirosoma profusum]MBD2705349.1 hypothetical protein [Spirosoma profusum]
MECTPFLFIDMAVMIFWRYVLCSNRGALYRLTGIPSRELTNTFVDAEVIWNKDIRLVSERLNSCDDLTEMLRIIESFLVNVVRSFRKHHHAVDVTSQLILNQQERITLDQLADQSCLSVR